MTSEELSLIIKRVLQELEAKKTCPTLLLCAENDEHTASFNVEFGGEYHILPWAENAKIPYAVLAVKSLTVAEIGRIACLAPQSPIEEEIVDALVKGKPVWVLTSSPNTSVGALKDKIASNEKLIQDYGVVFLESSSVCNQVDLTDRILITEKDLLHLPEKSVIVVKNPIFTPLAMDTVRMSQLQIQRK